MNILSVETAHPPNYYDQDALLNAFRKLWKKGNKHRKHKIRESRE